MPYGVKHGVKAPGEFGMADIFGLGLAGAAGIVAALITDFQQQGETSALYTINKWAVEIGGLFGYTDIPLWMVVVGLTAIGAGSVFYFQPITRQGAFAQGFGLLAVAMTAVPTDLASGIEAMNERLPGLEPAVETTDALLPDGIITANFVGQEAQLYQVQNATNQAAKYDLHLRIEFTNGIPANVDSMIRRGTIRGRLHNEDTAETWNLFHSSGGSMRREGDALIIDAGVPARSQTARLWVRIECDGYAIEEQSANAALGGSLNWTVELQPSSVPLFIQRLGKSYWF